MQYKPKPPKAREISQNLEDHLKRLNFRRWTAEDTKAFHDKRWLDELKRRAESPRTPAGCRAFLRLAIKMLE